MKEIKDLGFGIIQVNEPKPTVSKMESVDNYLCKWQKLKEWLDKEHKNQEPTDYEKMIYDEDYFIKSDYQIMIKRVKQKMQELEGEKDVED